MLIMAKNEMGIFGWVLYILLVVGGLNWGLVGLFQWDLVQFLSTGAGSVIVDSMTQRIVYILVGVAAAIATGMIPKLAKD